MSTRQEETRERILAAARRLLVRRGYHQVGIDEIAHAAGVSRQAIYAYHFRSKHQLLLALVDHVDRVEQFEELFRPVAEARTPLEALDRAIRAVATHSPRIYDIARVLDDARLTDRAAEAAWQNRMQRRRRGTIGLMRRLSRAGLLKPGWSVASATDLVWSLLSLQSYQLLVRERGWTLEQFVDRIGDTIRSTLITTAGRRR